MLAIRQSTQFPKRKTGSGPVPSIVNKAQERASANQHPDSADRSHRASPAKTKVGGVLMDAGLSHRLLALASSNVPSRPQRPTASRRRKPSWSQRQCRPEKSANPLYTKPGAR